MRFLFRSPRKSAFKPKSNGQAPFKLRAVLETANRKDLLQKLETIGGLKLFPDKEMKKLTISQNGKSTFVPIINKISLVYDPTSRASASLMTFIQTHLPAYARAYPYVEFAVTPTPRSKPVLCALYADGKMKNAQAGNLSIESIIYHLNELIQQDGSERVKYEQPVISDDSIVPLWNPFHATTIFKP